MRMTNSTKWLIAVPFVVLVAFVLPAVITRSFLWFRQGWPETVFLISTAGIWLAATAFVNVEKPRGKPDLANFLIVLGLILAVPVAVYDRTYAVGAMLPDIFTVLGILLCLFSIALGTAARLYLGDLYSPRSSVGGSDKLVTNGPYRLIRHPIYAAAIIWSLGWPLIIASIFGTLVTVGFVLPAVLNRMPEEEENLAQAHGAKYLEYREKTWRIIPHLY